MHNDARFAVLEDSLPTGRARPAHGRPARTEPAAQNDAVALANEERRSIATACPVGGIWDALSGPVVAVASRGEHEPACLGRWVG